MTFHTVTDLSVRAIRIGTRQGVRLAGAGAGAAARRMVPLPEVQATHRGRMMTLEGRGSTYVVDVPGPTPDAPVAVLLHALGVTAHLSWFAAISELSQTHRVVTFDQRWHGRGIRSDRFRFADCADDAVAVMDALDIDQAVIAGYSMGGAIAQLVWRRHPERVAALVLCSTARNYRGKLGEKAFFPVLGAASHPLAGYSLSRVERVARQLPEIPAADLSSFSAWGRNELRSTSKWLLPEVLGELGRFDSSAWIGEVDVPTAVVVTVRDRTIPARRQFRLAEAIPHAALRSSRGGHTSLFLDAKRWVPLFVDAVATVTEQADLNVREGARITA
ncbi:hypothetical protein GCM10027020_27750 [Nocardioides salsibiostraticola]